MENIQRNPLMMHLLTKQRSHCITIEELGSDNVSSIQSTNEIEESIDDDASIALKQKCLKDFDGSRIQISELGALFAYLEPLKASEKSVARLLLTQKWCQ
ncbi:hypothetical protein CsSME_00038047 [Camellia sinensis var. sinensis]